jgi:hypothetical protein
MEWKKWLNQLDKNVKVRATKRMLGNIKPWKVLKFTIKRIDNLFFKVNGYAIEIISKGVKNTWNQVLLQTEYPIHGWLILVVAEEDQPFYLLSARAEAGWKSLGLGPTFQASKSNLLKNPKLARRKLIESDHLLQSKACYRI